MEAEELMNGRELLQVLEEYGNALKEEYKKNLIKSDRLGTENLLNSVGYHVDHNGTKYEVFIDVLSYWKYVEYDTKPHFPNVEKLRTWIRVKPVLPRPMANGKLPTEKQLAFLIGRKIAQVGTQGSHDLTNACEQINREYRPKIAEALQKMVGERFNEWIVRYF